MVLSFIRRKRGEVIQAQHVNELQIAAEQLDAEKAKITVSETEPTSPKPGDLWFDPTSDEVSLARVITISEEEPSNPMPGDLWIDI